MRENIFLPLPNPTTHNPFIFYHKHAQKLNIIQLPCFSPSKSISILFSTRVIYIKKSYQDNYPLFPELRENFVTESFFSFLKFFIIKNPRFTYRSWKQDTFPWCTQIENPQKQKAPVVVFLIGKNQSSIHTQ